MSRRKKKFKVSDGTLTLTVAVLPAVMSQIDAKAKALTSEVPGATITRSEVVRRAIAAFVQ